MSLRTYVARRLISMFPLLFGIITINFFIVALAPGNPAQIAAGLSPDADPHAFAVAFGLEEIVDGEYVEIPLMRRYAEFLVVTFFTQDFRQSDFAAGVGLDVQPHNPMMGRSWRLYPKGVLELIGEKIGATLMMTFSSLILGMAVAVVIGTVSATKQNSLYDRISTVCILITFSVPYFFLAKCIQLLSFTIFGWTGLFTSDAYDDPLIFTKYLVLPLITLVLGGSAFLSRMIRSQLLEILRQDYITTARSKGLPERSVVFKHAYKNAMLPLITIVGLAFPGLVFGATITELIFSYPGLGKEFFQSVLVRDMPLVLGGNVIFSFLLVIFILITDITYAFIDPRIRF